MMIHEVTEKAGRYKARKRVGRGRGSGVGKTSGRGHKGAGSRAGYSARHQFEGGQMPFFRRHSKRGFTNVQFTTEFWCVNLGDLLKHPDFASGGKVTPETLRRAHLVRDETRPVKLLGDMRGEDSVSVKLEVDVDRVTRSVRAAIEAAGGTIHERGSRRDRYRGIDRNSDDQTPKNLTKKLRRSSGAGGGEAAAAAGGGKKKKKKKKK
jgi:large subunit ribosomal protein L15